MKIGKNIIRNPQSGQKSDLKLSFSDYNNIASDISDYKISKPTLLSFKHLYKANIFQVGKDFISLAIPNYLLTRLIFGSYYRPKANFRDRVMIMLFFQFWGTAFIFYRPVPRRLNTQILTLEGLDGKYIRNTIKV